MSPGQKESCVMFVRGLRQANSFARGLKSIGVSEDFYNLLLEHTNDMNEHIGHECRAVDQGIRLCGVEITKVLPEVIPA